MNRVVYYVMAIIMLMSLSSCIKEDMEECKVQFTVKVFVEDKQYINIDEVPQVGKKDENSPFREFVGTIYYVLRNPSTGAVVYASSFTPVMENVPYYTIVLNNIPPGMYELNVWGNITDQTLTSSLHPSGTEQTDLYMGYLSLQFTSDSQTAELPLKRTKGNLVLLCNNFPQNMTRVEQKISSIYQNLDPYFTYSNEGAVIKNTQIQSVNQFLIAPTVLNKVSKVNMRFYDPNDQSGKNDLVLPAINVNISRNKLSLISVDYKAEMNTWEVWAFIDNKWTLIHQLDIK